MKKILILSLFLLNFMLNWQDGQLKLTTVTEAFAAWGIELGEVEVYPDAPDDPDPDPVWPNDPDDDDDDDDYPDDDCFYGDCDSWIDDDISLGDLSTEELQKLINEWNKLNWSNPNIKYMISLSKDGILTGYIYKDRNGNIRYQAFESPEVIIIASGPKGVELIFTGIYQPFDPSSLLMFPTIDPILIAEDPCPPTMTGITADLIFSLKQKTNYGNGNIDSLTTILRNSTKEKFESGLTIAKYGNEYYVHKFPSDASYIQKGDTHNEERAYNSVSLSTPYNTAYFTHVHYDGVIAAPSPGDVVSLYESYVEQYGNYVNNGDDEPIVLEGSFIICPDGVEYLISIDDHKMLQDFIDKMYMEGTDGIERDDKNGSLFKAESNLGKDYNEVYGQMKKNYSKEDAMTYTLSHVLSKFKTGINIEKRNSRTKLFEKKETQETPTKKGIKYEHKKCD